MYPALSRRSCGQGGNDLLPCCHGYAHVPQGFQRVADNLEDTCLDNPRAREDFPAIVAAAHRDGWLDSTFQARHLCAVC